MALRRAQWRARRSRKSAAAERLAHVLALHLPPLVHESDVGADGEVPDANVEEILRLIGGGISARGGE
jgi:hypothetical protein